MFDTFLSLKQLTENLYHWPHIAEVNLNLFKSLKLFSNRTVCVCVWEWGLSFFQLDKPLLNTAQIKKSAVYLGQLTWNIKYKTEYNICITYLKIYPGLVKKHTKCPFHFNSDR